MNTLSERLAELSGKATPGDWFNGSWGGVCRKPSHQARGHPGPQGKNPCVYEPERYDFGGIAADSGESVVSTEYDELILSVHDAALIVELVNAYRAGRLIVKDEAHD